MGNLTDGETSKTADFFAKYGKETDLTGLTIPREEQDKLLHFWAQPDAGWRDWIKENWIQPNQEIDLTETAKHYARLTSVLAKLNDSDPKMAEELYGKQIDFAELQQYEASIKQQNKDLEFFYSSPLGKVAKMLEPLQKIPGVKDWTVTAAEKIIDTVKQAPFFQKMLSDATGDLPEQSTDSAKRLDHFSKYSK